MSANKENMNRKPIRWTHLSRASDTIALRQAPCVTSAQACPSGALFLFTRHSGCSAVSSPPRPHPAMKNPHLESLGRRMRQYHRSNPWILSEGGIYVRHAYWDMKPDSLSFWDDTGFVLNRRQYMVWWRHPRYVYADAIEQKALDELRDDPGDDWLFDGATKNYKMVGKSGKRKKLTGYTSRQPSDAQAQYYADFQQTKDRIAREGIDLVVRPSWTWRRMTKGMGVEIVAPLEVRSAGELAPLADLARQLVLGKTTLAQAFPGFQYDRADWLRERPLLYPLADAEGSWPTMALQDDITALTALVQRMAEESGNPQGFDARAWVEHWLVSTLPALGGRRPLDVLQEPGGLDLLCRMLLQVQAGAFS